MHRFNGLDVVGYFNFWYSIVRVLQQSILLTMKLCLWLHFIILSLILFIGKNSANLWNKKQKESTQSSTITYRSFTTIPTFDPPTATPLKINTLNCTLPYNPPTAPIIINNNNANPNTSSPLDKNIQIEPASQPASQPEKESRDISQALIIAYIFVRGRAFIGSPV